MESLGVSSVINNSIQVSIVQITYTHIYILCCINVTKDNSCLNELKKLGAYENLSLLLACFEIYYVLLFLRTYFFRIECNYSESDAHQIILISQVNFMWSGKQNNIIPYSANPGLLALYR